MATLSDVINDTIQGKGLAFVLGDASGHVSPDLQAHSAGEHIYSSEQIYALLTGKSPGETGYSYTYGSNTPSKTGNFTIINEGSSGKFKAAASDTSIIIGSGGDDKIIGTTNASGQVIFGMDGNDTIIGRGTGPNFLSGNDGGDTIKGGKGADNIHGDAGNDTLKGNAGDDKIYGGTGNDNIDGGAGADLINGSLGNDKLKGGAGADTFTFSANDGKQFDTIQDFGKGGADKITLSDGLTIKSHAYDAALKGTVVTLSDNSKILLKGVTDAKYTDHITEKTDKTELDWHS